MTRASDEFLNALASLRKAAGAVEGGTQQAAAQILDQLARLAGAEGQSLKGGVEGLSFAEALGRARKLAERELSGNAFYSAVNKLDALAALAKATPAAADAIAEPAPPAAPEEPTKAFDPSIEGVLQGASFDEISAAAKARVGEVAASLGIEVVDRHHEPAPQQRNVEAPPVEAAELEKRSSEPCAMPEVLPLNVEPVSSAAVEAISVREVVEAAHDIGTPAMVAEPLPEAPAEIHSAPPEPIVVAAPPPAPEPVVEAPAPQPNPAVSSKPEPAPALAKEAPAAKRDAAPLKKESKPKQEPTPPKTQQKTLFGLWLDILFGRRK
jgi:hypothetical protein